MASQIVNRKPKLCFFARVSTPDVLSRNEFYRQDLEALQALECQLVVATTWGEIPWDADLYFVWWWTWAFLPLAKAKLGRRPVMVTGTFDYRWPVPGRDYFGRPFWERWLLRFALWAADVNVFVSTLEMNALCQDLPVRNPCYVPHCVDTDLYVTGTRPREPFLLSVVWMVGENPKRKCLAQAIEAFAQVRRNHPGLRYVIIGEKGDAYPSVADLAARLGVSHAVEFTGVVSREEKISLMQRCALYLQPSLYEGFGLAILEAMSCGAPVVTSAVGAVPEVVGDAAVFVDGRSPIAVANGVLGLLGSPDRALQLGDAGRQRAVQLYPLSRRRHSLAELVARQLQKRGWQLPPQSARTIEEPLAPELKQK